MAATGDLRSVLYADVCLLGGLALAMILVARRLRGRTVISDAFFAFIWLHLGNYVNLLWAFSFTNVLPIALSCTVLVTIVSARQPLGRWSAVVVGLCAICLPLCGGTGLAQAPAIAAWLVVAGILALRSPVAERRHSGGLMLCLGVLSWLVCGLYFVGFESPGALPSLPALLEASGRFATLSVGPAAGTLWPYSGVLVLGSLGVTLLLLLRALRSDPAERLRILGLLAYLGGLVCMALAVGYKGMGGNFGFRPRYVGMPAPFLCAAYLSWSRYAPVGVAGSLQATWCLLMGAALLQYGSLGIEHGRQGARVMESFARDARRGTSLPQLAERHWKGLYPDEDRFRGKLVQLRGLGFAPFEDLPKSPLEASSPSGPGAPKGRPIEAGAPKKR